MKVLLLGGAGFIGAHIISELHRRGGYELFVLEPATAPADRIQGFPVHLLRGSISDTAFLDEVITQNRIETVVHLVSGLIPGSDFAAFERECAEVVTPTIRLMSRCAEKHVRFVFFSSGGTVYGDRKDHRTPFEESEALAPISYYGWSKQLLEDSIYFLHRTQGLSYLVLRPSNAYGPGQNLNGKQGIVAVALGKILKGEPVTIWGDGSAVRDYIYIDDLARAVCDILSDETIVDTTLNVGSGEGHSVNEIIGLLKQVTRKDFEVTYSSSRSSDVSNIVLNIDRLKQRIPFTPIDIEEGIERFYHSLIHG